MSADRLHILIIPSERYVSADEPLGGIFQYHQAHALSRARFRIGVVAPAPVSLRYFLKGVRRARLPKLIDHEGAVNVYRNRGYAWTLRRSPLIRWLWLRAGESLFRMYLDEQGKPDLIHAHNALYAGALAKVLSDKYRLPYVLTEHSSIYAQGRVQAWQSSLVRGAMINAKGRAVVSAALGELLERQFGEIVHPWEWIPNILEKDFEEKTLESLSNHEGEHMFRFLTLGALIDIKNHSSLLKAFSHKFKFEENVELRIGGDGPLRKKLETEATELGIAERVIFLGWLTRQQVHEELRNCDVFVLSSNHETFGVVLIEALAYGKPVISTACGGPQGILNDFNGLLVPPQDPISLGDGMWNLMRRRQEYDSSMIRRDCLQRFGEQAVVDKLTKFYNRAISKDDQEGAESE